MADDSISRLSPRAVLKLATLAVEAHLSPSQTIDKRSADEFSQCVAWFKRVGRKRAKLSLSGQSSLAQAESEVVPLLSVVTHVGLMFYH